MAIKGIGIDIVEISRISNMLSGYGDKFINKIYTHIEAEICAHHTHRSRLAAAFAGRFAAKEAFYKALPDVVQRVSSWKSIQILTDSATGKPRVDVCNERLRQALLECGISSIHLSISHEKTHCAAVVVLTVD